MKFAPMLLVVVLGLPLVAEAQDSKLKDLLKERLATPKAVVKATTQDYLTGKVSFDRVYQATKSLLNAELEFAETKKERIAVLEKIVALAKESEKSAVLRYKAGTVPHSDALLATAGRLDAEIALERAKAKIKAKTE
jgi:outer membrane protein TolC